MEITVKSIENIEFKDFCSAYTVYVEDHRILTIATYHDTTASKWIKDVQRRHRSKNGTLTVGVCVGKEYLDYNYRRGFFTFYDYEIIQLCVGSHCLIYHLPERYSTDDTSKFLVDFFKDPSVVAVGIDMATMGKNLEKNHGITVENPVDLRNLAFKVLKRHDLDLPRYDLDRLAKVVLGKHVDVVRPEMKMDWFKKERSGYTWRIRKLREEKVKYATVDPYLCFLMGSELFDMVDGASSASLVKKEKKKKKKNINKNKNK